MAKKKQKQPTLADLKTLTKNEKIAGAKHLRATHGMTYSKIAEWLGISDDSAERYVKKYSLDEETQTQLEKHFAGIVRGMQMVGLHKVHERLNELIPEETKISEVVKAGEFYRGGNNGNTININIDNKAKELDDFVVEGQIVND